MPTRMISEVTSTKLLCHTHDPPLTHARASKFSLAQFTRARSHTHTPHTHPTNTHTYAHKHTHTHTLTLSLSHTQTHTRMHRWNPTTRPSDKRAQVTLHHLLSMTSSLTSKPTHACTRGAASLEGCVQKMRANRLFSFAHTLLHTHTHTHTRARTHLRRRQPTRVRASRI